MPAELEAAWGRIPPQVRSQVKAWGICLRFETTTAFGNRFGLDLPSRWGVANPFKGELVVSPKAPANRRFDVLAHELAHLSPGLVHGYIDGSLRGKAAEKAADKRACEWGATWVNYLGSC